MNFALNIKLHENQKKIHSSNCLYKVIKAGKRFGKSKWAVFSLLQEAGKYPNKVYWYIAPTYKQAKSIAWREFKLLIPHQFIKRMVENELLIVLINDTEIHLKGADNEDSLRGPKFDGAVFDEAAYVNPYIWPNIIMGQLLGSEGEKPGFAWFISSPLNPTESIGKEKVDWFPEFYQEALRKKMSGDVDWDAFHFTIYDNPTLNKDQIDTIRANNTDDAWQVEYMANESAFAGTVFSEFKYETHAQELEPSGVFVRGLDWGIAHPTACLFIHVDKEKNLVYVDDEYVKSGFTIEESSEVIKSKTGGKEVFWTVCDPSMNKRNSQTHLTDKQEFDRLGIFCIPGDNNARGYNIVKMFLKKGIIKINPRCRILIKQLKSLQWGQDVNDDLTDCLRYSCVRIHDLDMVKMKDVYIKEEVKPFVARPFNFNDKQLFPKMEMGYSSSIMEEMRAY